MIVQILVVVFCIDIVVFSILIGVVLGQRSVWKHLKKKDVTIDGWQYTATKTEKEHYKRWD